MTRARQVFLALAVIASLLIVIGTATGGDVFGWARAPLLMPFVFIFTLFARPRPTPRFFVILLVAQVFSWLGDIALALGIDALFLVGVALFLCAQISYILTFRGIPGDHLLKRKRWVLLPYVVYWVGILALMLPRVEVALVVPLLIYGTVLISMAVAAVDTWDRVPRVAGQMLLAGSILFVISDSMIALTKFGPLHSGAVEDTILIGTYCVAQILLALGVIRAAVQVSSESAGTRP